MIWYPLMSVGFLLIIKDSKSKVLQLNNTVICGDVITEHEKMFKALRDKSAVFWEHDPPLNWLQ